MDKVKSYEDLDVWKMAIEQVENVYSATNSFPQEEVYGLTAQIRRAAVSVPSNIAEDWGRNTTKDYLRFLSMAR